MQSPRISTTKSTGFTLVELLISMGIFASLVSLGLFVSMDFYRSYAFRSQSSLLISTLERTRNRSQNNINGIPHGIRLASESYTLFAGTSYETRKAEYDESFLLDNGAMIPGPSTDIVFSQLTGESNASRSITLTDGVHTATISLNYAGRISW